MRLDTGILNREATLLYESLGFRRRGPYADIPEDFAAILIYMEAELAPPQSTPAPA